MIPTAQPSPSWLRRVQYASAALTHEGPALGEQPALTPSERYLLEHPDAAAPIIKRMVGEILLRPGSAGV